MAKYVFIYKGGGMPESEEEGQRLMQAWMTWLGGLGDAVVDAGNPFGASTSVGAGGTPGATGYSVINADSLDDASAKAMQARFGNDGLIQLTGAIGYYSMLAMTVNACELEAAPNAEILQT